MNLTGINLNFVFEVLKKYTNVHVQVLQKIMMSINVLRRKEI